MAKSILNPSRIEGVAYAINPYVGCQHACVYCYARFMSRYTGHQGERWGSFVDIKINAARVLQQQLRRRRNPLTDTVLFSSVTDAYQPLEKRYEITRACLGLLRSHDVPVSVLTKSDLVVRDIDLLGEIPETEVGVTIISLDEQVRRVFEAGAPTAERRLVALSEFASQGIRTYAFVGPIIPYLSTPTLEELFQRLAECGISYLFIDKLNIKYGNRPEIEKTLYTHFPDKARAILAALQSSSTYYLELREELEELAHRHGLTVELLF